MIYTYITIKGINGNYIAKVQEHPQLIVAAENKKELIDRIKEAIINYLQTNDSKKDIKTYDLQLLEVNYVDILNN